MAYITLDFETFYRSRANRGTPGPRYSLSNLTYEQYIRHPEFKVHGVAIKINGESTTWTSARDVKPYLRELFVPGNDHTLICHNTSFDAAILSWYYGLAAKTYYCTQSMSRALWQTEKHSLDALARRCFPDDPTKRKGDELESVDGIYNLTPEQDDTLAGYAINDVDLTFECFAHMWRFFPDIELELIDLTLQMAVHPLLELDIPRVQRFLEATQTEKEALIKASGVSRTLLSSNKQFVEWLEREHGITVPKKHSPTPKNPNNYTWALAKDDLEFHALRREYPELEPVWQARIAVKSTTDESRAISLMDAAEPLPHKPAGVISMPLNYAAAHTLRWGGGQRRNPQNLRRGGELRKSLMAPEGHMLCVADLSNIESRMLAWVSGCHPLLTAYSQDRDVYNDFGFEIYGRAIDRKNGDELEGFISKVAVLGLGYGMGAPKFQDTLAKGALGGPPVYMEMEECHRIVYQVYRKKYAEIPALWREFENIIIPSMANPNIEPFDWKCFRVEHQRLRLPNRLYLNYPDLRAIDHPDGGYEYWNGMYYKSLYGGLATENATQAISRCVLAGQMLEIRSRIAQYDANIILTVHDEVIAVAPEKHAETVLNIMLTTMRETPDWCSDGTLVLDAEGGIAREYSK